MGCALGRGEERSRLSTNALLCCSAGERPDDDQVLPVPGEGRRLGVGAEPRDDRAQQPVVAASLHRQRQPRPHVSTITLSPQSLRSEIGRIAATHTTFPVGLGTHYSLIALGLVSWISWTDRGRCGRGSSGWTAMLPTYSSAVSNT